MTTKKTVRNSANANSSSSDEHRLKYDYVSEAELGQDSSSDDADDKRATAYQEQAQTSHNEALPHQHTTSGTSTKGESNFKHDLLKTAARAVVWCAVYTIFGAVFDADEITDG